MTTERNALDFPYLQGNVDIADVDLESAPPFRLYGNIVAGPPEGAAARLCGYFERACDARPSSTALECDGESLSYADLDRRANRLANYLIGRGVRAGTRVGILLDRSVNTYVALLGVTKTEATFVPIDPAAPADRLQFIAEDSDLGLMITTSDLAAAATGLPCPTVRLDELAGELAGRSSRRPAIEPVGDPVCYVIYTSGSSGQPKGVQIAQSSICNFIGIVPTLYGVQPTERVYQGMTISFDFSIEEIWPTWAVGATLVAGPTDGRRVGSGLADFLEEQQITMIYCVPTVLATLDRTLPLIHTVNVGGEACPRELVDRWGPGRRILNTYGPTETTVTCTMAELEPGKPVTIGHPLPSYRVTLLDEDRRPVPHGEIGEICVGGPGVGRGTSTARSSRRTAFSRIRRAVRGTGSTARGTWGGFFPTARSSTWAARTARSRSAATASTCRRSRTCSSSTPGSRSPWWRSWSPPGPAVISPATWSCGTGSLRRSSSIWSSRSCTSGSSGSCPPTWSRPTWTSSTPSPCCPAARPTGRVSRHPAAPGWSAASTGTCRRPRRPRHGAPASGRRLSGCRPARCRWRPTSSTGSAATRCSPPRSCPGCGTPSSAPACPSGTSTATRRSARCRSSSRRRKAPRPGHRRELCPVRTGPPVAGWPRSARPSSSPSTGSSCCSSCPSPSCTASTAAVPPPPSWYSSRSPSRCSTWSSDGGSPSSGRGCCPAGCSPGTTRSGARRICGCG